ncbi:NAD(P)-binding protein [Jimgerdemannia flammicorona]|uniref:NAD(P)-binding protein n=1 Tax=Jimgerdemannia flammicorona TaxID=994334 RepID=A0A433Q197_9FUNG|nr:NAD(P)-binding protein [Jimgerdemannia flammicorona]
MSFARLTTEFLSSKYFAVAGASVNRTKFGNKVLRWYIAHNRPVSPINRMTASRPSPVSHPPTSLAVQRETTIEGLPVLSSLTELPFPTETAVSVITPPDATLGVLKEAHQVRVPYVWLQPGAQSEEALTYAREVGLKIIFGGPCILADGDKVLEHLAGKL